MIDKKSKRGNYSRLPNAEQIQWRFAPVTWNVSSLQSLFQESCSYSSRIRFTRQCLWHATVWLYLWNISNTP